MSLKRAFVLASPGWVQCRPSLLPTLHHGTIGGARLTPNRFHAVPDGTLAFAHLARAVAELIGAKQGEVRLLLQGRLEASRAREMTEQMMAAGLPV